jgi:hypothetical protein
MREKVYAGGMVGVAALALGACLLLQSASGAPAARDGEHDFDFLVGRFKVHMKRLSPETHQWVEFDGYGVYRQILNGRGNINEFVADSPTGHIRGLTLRTYNPATHLWSLYWANSQDGILDSPQLGQFKDGVGEFYAQDTIDGKFVFVRYVWSKVTPNSAHFEQAFSSNGGKSWEVNWQSDMTRLAESEALPEDRAPNEAAAGQHDFDGLLGDWRYTLKRRLKPLTGSTTWIDMAGTGDCTPFWHGQANLDTFAVDGPNGRIDGITLRLFNPKTHEWRLYWANRNDGIVSVPQIGQFHDGHGEFYAMDTLNDKNILVKYDWTALSSRAPHFEQSFSNDGGKTWEVNWVTEQTRR